MTDDKWCVGDIVVPLVTLKIRNFVVHADEWGTLIGTVVQDTWSGPGWSGWEQTVLVRPWMQRPDHVVEYASATKKPAPFGWPADSLRLATRDEILSYELTR